MPPSCSRTTYCPVVSNSKPPSPLFSVGFGALGQSSHGFSTSCSGTLACEKGCKGSGFMAVLAQSGFCETQQSFQLHSYVMRLLVAWALGLVGTCEAARLPLARSDSEVRLRQAAAEDAAKELVEATKVKCQEARTTRPGQRNDSPEPPEKELCQELLSKSVSVSESVADITRSVSAQPAIAAWFCSGLKLAAGHLREGPPTKCIEVGKDLLKGLNYTLNDDGGSTGKEHAEKALFVTAYLMKAACVLAPMPPPFATMIDKAADAILAKMNEDAKMDMHNLETKMKAMMWDVSHKVVAEETLRVATAKAKIAEEQIDDMKSLDEYMTHDLWSDALTSINRMHDEVAEVMQKVVESAQKSASFNRWAAIEQSLATSSVDLTPPNFLTSVEDRRPFAKLMETHFKMQLVVLARMWRAVQDTEHQDAIREALQKKAQRAALDILPDLILLNGRSTPEDFEPGVEVHDANGMHFKSLDEEMYEAFSTQLLLTAASGSCAKMVKQAAKPTNSLYLIKCHWLPLLGAVPFRRPLSVTRDVYDTTHFEVGASEK